MKLSQRMKSDNLQIKKKLLLQGKRKLQRAVEPAFIAVCLSLSTDSYREWTEAFLREYVY